MCPTLRAELEEVRAALCTLEKSAMPSSIPACEFCDAQSELMEEVKGVRDNMEYENTHLREVLSLVSSNEPQLRIMIQNFKRGDSMGVGFKYPQPSEAGVAKLREESGSRLSPKEKFPKTFDKPSYQINQPKDGVIDE